jgi:drug/metabolite transporter (DMT)-like permease
MTLMIVGEICNVVAYAFTDAIIVTSLGALTVVIATILSAIFLKERLSLIGKVSCFLCIVGSIVIVMNAPHTGSVKDIQTMQSYVIHPLFLSYTGVVLVGSAITALWAGPKWGNKNMLVYISVCSWVGGLSVVSIQGLGAAVVAWAGGKPQYKEWFMWVLLVFVIITLLVEIVYLNVSNT